jgi:hypothetical protein
LNDILEVCGDDVVEEGCCPPPKDDPDNLALCFPGVMAIHADLDAAKAATDQTGSGLGQLYSFKIINANYHEEESKFLTYRYICTAKKGNNPNEFILTRSEKLVKTLKEFGGKIGQGALWVKDNAGDKIKEITGDKKDEENEGGYDEESPMLH